MIRLTILLGAALVIAPAFAASTSSTTCSIGEQSVSNPTSCTLTSGGVQIFANNQIGGQVTGNTFTLSDIMESGNSFDGSTEGRVISSASTSLTDSYRFASSPGNRFDINLDALIRLTQLGFSQAQGGMSAVIAGNTYPACYDIRGCQYSLTLSGLGELDIVINGSSLITGPGFDLFSVNGGINLTVQEFDASGAPVNIRELTAAPEPSTLMGLLLASGIATTIRARAKRI